MPSVSPAHREQQRRRILDAARGCFLANGFHQTSMDDVIAAAGMSAGGLYRYFRGKDEIIAAIAGDAISGLTGEVEELLAERPAPPPAAALGRLLRVFDRLAAPGGTGRLAIQAWGEAQRDPQIAALARREYATLGGHLAALVQRWRDEGEVAADAPVEPVAQLVAALMIGYLVQKVLLTEADPERFLAGFLAVTGTRSRPAPPAAPARRDSVDHG